MRGEMICKFHTDTLDYTLDCPDGLDQCSEKPLIVVITGDRNWTNEEVIRERLRLLPPGSMIITGGCRGADTLAEKVAHSLNFPVMVFPYPGQYGKAGGPIRNGWMLDETPDLVIAFHNDLSKSKGTANCVKQARERGIKVEVISEGGFEGGYYMETLNI